jgi:glutamate-1-semialdehyde 2,1-aminomutase
MAFLAPVGPVYQAGTLSGNPLAMTAGLTMLQLLQEHPQTYSSLDEKTAYLHNEMTPILEQKGIPYQINRLGSMLSLHFTNTPVVDFDTAAKGNNDFFKTYFHGMLKRGVYLPPSAFESYFLNDAISQEDLEHTLEAFSETLKEL